MSYDIYGEPLRRGHCEVHPHVHEEYPCSVCISQSQRANQNHERNPTPMELAAPDMFHALNLALEYWQDRQQRYKNRSPVWVQEARAAIAKAKGET